MKRIEAIALLAGCVPLANRLAALGVNIPLDQADLAALEGFHQVWQYEEGWWLDDPGIYTGRRAWAGMI